MPRRSHWYSELDGNKKVNSMENILLRMGVVPAGKDSEARLFSR